MQSGIQCAKEFSSLYESVNLHAQHLNQMLAAANPSNELRDEVESLNRLLSSFTYTNERMQDLLVWGDASLRRERLREAFKILRLRGIIEGREPLAELREVSNRTICRALALLKRAQGGDSGEVRREVRNGH
jgi:hypothetical protein